MVVGEGGIAGAPQARPLPPAPQGLPLVLSAVSSGYKHSSTVPVDIRLISLLAKRSRARQKRAPGID